MKGRKPSRSVIEEEMQRFLEKGGKIEVLPPEKERDLGHPLEVLGSEFQYAWVPKQAYWDKMKKLKEANNHKK